MASRLATLRQERFEPATGSKAVPLNGHPEAPAGEPKPQGAKLPSQLSADPVVAGMQIGNFIAAAVYGPKGERR